MIKSVKLRIYPNKTQLEIIHDTLSACRFVRNQYIAYNIHQYKDKKIFVSAYDFCKLITVWKKDEPTFQWLKGISSKAIADSVIETEAEFKSFFKAKEKTKENFPKYKSKKKKHREYFNFTKKSIHYTDTKNIIKLPILKKVRISNPNDLPELSYIINGRIVREHDKYYVLFTYNKPRRKLYRTDTRISVVIGSDKYATLYTGDKIIHSRHYKNTKNYIRCDKKIARLQNIIKQKANINRIRLIKEYTRTRGVPPVDDETLDQITIDSHKTSQIRRLIKKIRVLRRKKFNIRWNHINTVCDFLTVKAKPYEIVLGDDNISDIGSNVENNTLRQYEYNTAFNRFKIRLQSKCLEYGITLKLLHKYYPSRVLCSVCQKDSRGIDVYSEIFKCKHCGREIDKDKNTALNIYFADAKYCAILA